jgi:hypothetical protein
VRLFGSGSYWYEIVRDACAHAFCEALSGSAAGREGFVTFADLAGYISSRLADPKIIQQTGKLQVQELYSNRSSKDILVGAMPSSRASPYLESDRTGPS